MDFYSGTQQAANEFTYALGPSVWWILFWAIFAFFMIYSIILLYHWFTFAMKRRTAIMATVLYFAISAVFIFSMLVGVVALSS